MAGVSFRTSISSIRAQRRAAEASLSLARSFERLSSGMRINRASDDAAGLAVSSALRTDSRVYSQALKNANDGLSLLNIADGALGQLGSIVTRLKELAEQAANGVLSSTQRVALDREAQQLSKEYTRIIRSTTFNGRTLFDNDFGRLSIQTGYGTQGSILSGLGGSVGTGSFTQGSSYSLANTPTEVQLSDINSDGILDSITLDDNANITVRLGQGSGTFGAALTLATGASWGIDFAVGDFNGDGNRDIFSLTDVAFGRLFLGNGDGSFQSPLSISSIGNQVVSGDFNRDGIDDIAVDSGSGISIKLGQASGGFVSAYGPYTVTSSGQMQVGDFNNDGVEDLVIASFSANFVKVLLGNGDGSFDSPISVEAGDRSAYVALGDVNNDGRLDIVTGDRIGLTFSVLLGQGDGTFSNYRSFSLDGSPSGVWLADFDGDGNLDLLAGYNDGSNVMRVFAGAGNGEFSLSQTVSSPDDAVVGAVGDINNDGIPDILGGISGGVSPSTLAFLSNSTDGAAPLLDFSLRTKLGALDALNIFDQTENRITLQRSVIGAFQSRLTSALSQLQSTTETYQTAYSRIVDADIAVESANLVRTQILQQSAMAVLAQANLSSNIALTLLGV